MLAVHRRPGAQAAGGAGGILIETDYHQSLSPSLLQNSLEEFRIYGVWIIYADE